MGKQPFRRLIAVFLISASVPSIMAVAMGVSAAQAIGLMTRDSNTCGTGYNTCGQGLPSSFCCGNTTTCTPFNGGQSAICCPSGSDCSTILPIGCDIQQLNATAFPNNPMHTLDLTGYLQTCGSNTCCPVGYSCNNNNCVLNGVTSSSSSTSPTSTATHISTGASSAATSTSSSGAAALPSADCNGFPPLAIIAGFFPGVVCGALLTVLIFMCIGRKRDEPKRKGSDFGHINATVSDPIYQDAGATRTDFLRRQSKSRNGDGTNRTSSIQRVRSLFSRSPSLAGRSQKSPGIQMEPMPHTPENMAWKSREPMPQTPQRMPASPMDDMPRTPQNRMSGGLHREPSMESIMIYSPPDGRLGGPGSRGTTFTEMLTSVGLKPDEPFYMGSPGMVDPRSRDVGNGQLRGGRRPL